MKQSTIGKQVCFCFSILVLLPVMASGQMGKLKTKVKPAEAAVWVDGKFAGHADRFNGPGQSLSLPAGNHDIRISLVYHQDYETKVTIEPNSTTVIKQQLGPSDERRPGPPYADGKLRCKPDVDAAVMVNGRFIGHCDQMNGPAQALLLWVGHHDIEVRLSGYQTFKTSIDVTEAMTGKEVDIQAQLQPGESAEVAVNSPGL